MKKVLAILLALSVLALSACAAKQANSDTQKDSNTAETEQQPDSAQTAETQQPAQEAKRIEPLAESLDLNALTDATVAASFGAEDISEKDGKTEITLTVYDYDVYDMVDISQLAVGDTIVVDGKDMVVASREDKDGFVTINGGLEQGGVDLTSDDSGFIRQGQIKKLCGKKRREIRIGSLQHGHDIAVDQGLHEHGSLHICKYTDKDTYHNNYAGR